MPWRIICGLVALFVLTNTQVNASRSSRHRWENINENLSDNLIDIDVEETESSNNAGDQVLPEYVSGSGSGFDTDDEDLLTTSGSGSGNGAPDFTDTSVYTTKSTTSTSTTTTKPPIPLTPCEQLRDASKHLYGNYIPRCTDKGDYDSLQCRGHPGTGTCWCADLGGREIPGTALKAPNVPRCDDGGNLPPCVFELVHQSRTRLLGSFRPNCTLEGDFQAKQCVAFVCHCVDPKSGVKIPNTEVFLPDDPHCDGWNRRPKPTEKITLSPGQPKTTTVPDGTYRPRPTEKDLRKGDGGITLSPGQPKTTAGPNINIEQDGDKDKGDKKPDDSNKTGGTEGEPMRERSSAAHVMTQPGILAAIIGGSVVLLLCAILLIMFIVYRMRKKDEGSYALDEPKKMPNYSYQRAPDREFYA